MKISAEPRSDQWNGDDFINGKAKVFTIADVKHGKAEQKYDIVLAEGEGRVWRPPLTVLRILMDAWGDESDEWIGRRVALYREASVTFGKEKTGGIRISHMSDLPGGKPFEHNSTVSRGCKQTVVIKPLADAPPAAEPISDDDAIDFERDIAEATSLQQLNKVGADLKAANLGGHADKLRAAWSARKAEIEGGAQHE